MTHYICIYLSGLAKKFVRVRCSGRRRTTFLANPRFIQIQTETKVWWNNTYSYHEQYILLFSFVVYFIFKAVLTHWIDIMTHCWVAAHIFKHWARCSLALQPYDSLSSWELPPALAFPPPWIPLLFIVSFAQHKIVTVCMFFIHLSVFLAPQWEGNLFFFFN